MTDREDEIYDVYWEGPYGWGQRKAVGRRQHVLYAIFGTHRVYGQGALLYLGKTKRVGGRRLDDHNWWVREESDPVGLRLASIGKFQNWRTWETIERYSPPSRDIVDAIEKLLIHAHQPAYNSQELQELKPFRALRMFNSGAFATLLPEVSDRYYVDPRHAV